MTKEEYIKCGGVRCLYCGSEKLTHDKHAYVDYEESVRDVTLLVYCDVCGESWVDVYALSDAVPEPSGLNRV